MSKISPDSELAIQSAFFEWIDLNKVKYPALDLFFAIPNSAKRGKFDGYLMKLSGTRKGVPDTCLPVASFAIDVLCVSGMQSYRPKYYGLWIEFKSAKGRVSPEQKLWHSKLQLAGHYVVICRSWSEAANIVIDYLGMDVPKL